MQAKRVVYAPVTGAATLAAPATSFVNTVARRPSWFPAAAPAPRPSSPVSTATPATLGTGNKAVGVSCTWWRPCAAPATAQVRAGVQAYDGAAATMRAGGASDGDGAPPHLEMHEWLGLLSQQAAQAVPAFWQGFSDSLAASLAAGQGEAGTMEEP